MKKINLGQKALKKMYEYPKNWQQGPRLLVSNSYITNGYIIVHKDGVKNFKDLSNDGNFNIEKVRELSKIECSPITDIQIEQAIGVNTEVTKQPYKKTGVVLIGEKQASLEIYRAESGDLFFMDYKNIIEFLNINVPEFFAASQTTAGFDSIGSFSVAIMPISVGGMNQMIEQYSAALKGLIHSLN